MKTAYVFFGEKPRKAAAPGSVLIKAEEYVEPGSIYEANAFAEELSRLTFPDGKRVASSFLYKGYELWWIHYNSLFQYFCLPYTQYRKLLAHLATFRQVEFEGLPAKHQQLFSCYLQAHAVACTYLGKRKAALPFGVMLQMVLTGLSLPVLMLRRIPLFVFIGDKFEKDRDYDFRMKGIYEEVRRRKLPFFEIIRSLEPWNLLLAHAFRRRRPVLYSEAIAFLGRFMSVVTGGSRRARKMFGAHRIASVENPEKRFKLLIATQYLLGVFDDQWAIRLMARVLGLMGAKAGFVAAAHERNFHTVLAAKLCRIPTVGILHGVASRHYNAYDFMPAYESEKVLSIDQYGLWSAWWKEYYETYSRAYRPTQLRISGPMRPMAIEKQEERAPSRPLAVLFVGEQLGVPSEVLPYLRTLVAQTDLELYVKFRPYRDGFEEWLKTHEPELLGRLRIVRGPMREAIKPVQVVVGSHSTAVLEALFLEKPPIFYDTGKWGDYFELRTYHPHHVFFTETPAALIAAIHKSGSIPREVLHELRERFFGDPHKNGSAWAVDELERAALHPPGDNVNEKTDC